MTEPRATGFHSSRRRLRAWRMLFQTAVALARACCLLRIRSLDRLLPDPTETIEVLDARHGQQAQAVKGALSRVSRHLPGGPARCLSQALAVHYLFRSYGLAGYLFIGFRLDPDGQAKGHAWVRHNDLIVCGAPVDGFAVASIYRIGR